MNIERIKIKLNKKIRYGTLIFEFDWGFYALSASKVIFRYTRTYSRITYSRQIRTSDLSVHSRAVLNGVGVGVGGLFPIGRIVSENSPATCRPSPGGLWNFGLISSV